MLGGGGEGRGKAKISEGSPIFLATVRNPQSIRKVRGREWRSLAEWCAENHERSGKPENIPAGGDPLQMRFFAERLPPRMHGAFPAGARLRRPPNVCPRPSRPALRGCPRPHDARVRSSCPVRLVSRSPALAAQLCPLYLQLPEAQQNISPCVCR